jgi:sugar phosphate isomerase/epimerase
VLCSGTVRRASLEVTVRAASAAGFDGVSLYHRECVAASEAGWTAAAIRSLLDGEGIAVAELDGAMRWLPDEQRGPSLEEFVDVAAALDARSVTVIETAGRRVGVDVPLAEAAEAFGAVCDRAAAAGLLVHIEYFPPSGIPDSATAAAVARAAGRDNGGVLCDLWHHVRGPDAGVPEFGAAPVLGIQVGDVAAVPSGDLVHEMMHSRVLPGEGAADVAGLVRALRATGCTAPLEIEVYADELAARDPVDAARLAHAALVTVQAQLGTDRQIRRNDSSKPRDDSENDSFLR